MKQLRDEAFVLNTHALGETDLIVEFFALHHGKLRGVARGARKSRKRFGGALEPLTRVQVHWSEKPGRELQRIDSLECLRSHAAMQSDPALQAACAVVAEVNAAFAHEGQADPTAFRLLGAVLEAMEAGAPVWPVLRYFEYWMAKSHGLLPDLARCARCGRELAARRAAPYVVRAGVVCVPCAGRAGERGWRLTPSERAFLEAARVQPPGAMADAGGSAGPGGALEALLRGTLENFAERRFRAYRHLAAALGRGAAGSEPC